MSSEKFANLAETTLGADYTSGGSSITVASASGFPTTGVFRVRLGNASKTIYRVDSVSGTTFTGGAEANDGNATTGDTVVQVGTRGAMERFLQSPDSGAIAAPSGVSGGSYFGPVNSITPFDDTGFSWLNQGSATFSVVNGTAHLVVPQNSGQAIRGRVKSMSGSAQTFTVLFDTIMENSASQAAMFGFRESGTGKILVFRLEQATVRVSNGTTTIAGDIYAKNWNNGRAHSRIWLQVEYDTTNVKFRFSWDGVNYLEVLSETKGTHFTTAPDQVCFLGYDQNNSSFLHINLLSYKES